MAVNFTLFDKFPGNSLDALIDMDSDSFKAALTNSAPNQSTANVIGDITEIANGNGYTTGGVALTNVVVTLIGGGVYMFDCDDFSWTSSGAGMAAFRYGVIYSTTTNKLVGWWDHGSSISVVVGAQYQVVVNANGLFRTARSP